MMVPATGRVKRAVQDIESGAILKKLRRPNDGLRSGGFSGAEVRLHAPPFKFASPLPSPPQQVGRGGVLLLPASPLPTATEPFSFAPAIPFTPPKDGKGQHSAVAALPTAPAAFAFPPAGKAPASWAAVRLAGSSSSAAAAFSAAFDFAPAATIAPSKQPPLPQNDVHAKPIGSHAAQASARNTNRDNAAVEGGGEEAEGVQEEKNLQPQPQQKQQQQQQQQQQTQQQKHGQLSVAQLRSMEPLSASAFLSALEHADRGTAHDIGGVPASPRKVAHMGGRGDKLRGESPHSLASASPPFYFVIALGSDGDVLSPS
jgi:hypothetical protein